MSERRLLDICPICGESENTVSTSHDHRANFHRGSEAGLEVERLVAAIKQTAPILEGTSHEYAALLIATAYAAQADEAEK